MNTDTLRIQCCNPSKETSYSVETGKCSDVSQISKLYPQMVSGSKMYDKCRKEITMLKNAMPLSDTIVEDDYSQASYAFQINKTFSNFK